MVWACIFSLAESACSLLLIWLTLILAFLHADLILKLIILIIFAAHHFHEGSKVMKLQKKGHAKNMFNRIPPM